MRNETFQVQIGFLKKYVNYEIKLTHGYKSVTKSCILRLYEVILCISGYFWID